MFSDLASGNAELLASLASVLKATLFGLSFAELFVAIAPWKQLRCLNDGYVSCPWYHYHDYPDTWCVVG
jgi:hypothetical protein